MLIPKDRIENGAGRRGWVTAKFYGRDKAEIDVKAKRYFRSYDPRGYDTHYSVVPCRHVDGYWYTIIKRYASCD